MTIERHDPPVQGTEAEQLYGFLDYHRATLLRKTEGLTPAQLAQTLPPSTMTLSGMLKHLALNEDSWFRRVFLGEELGEPWASVDWDADQDWDWDSAEGSTLEELVSLWHENVSRAREAVVGADLDQLSARPGRRTGKPFTLRWIVLHMVEEYARHNGHADLLRESIDGGTGE